MSGDSPKSGAATPSDGPIETVKPKDVFISYASQDAPVANAVVEVLEKHGIRCWIAPRDVVPGSLYADEIVGAINDAKVIVLVLSEHAVTSPHVGKEIERASSKRRRIVAFHLDSAPLTRAFEYFLSESQWIDVGAGGTQAAIVKLVDSVRRHLFPSEAIAADASMGLAQPHPRASRNMSPVPRNTWMVATIVAVASLALAYFVADRYWVSKRVAEERLAAPAAPVAQFRPPVLATVSDKSVAVLPFVDMSEKKDQEYFSDGLSEELIDLLTKASDLQVAARTSSFYFKGKQSTIAEIAKALNVAHVLEGSVRKSGNTLRITVQLIRADNGYHLWSETYDRKLADIFRIQDEVAAAVVTAMRASLGARSTRAVIPTANLEAYNLYLQGRFHLRRSNKADTVAGKDYFARAVSLDPHFALAWAWLGAAHEDMYAAGWTTRVEGCGMARDATHKALQLDSSLVDAHLNLVFLALECDWDLAAGDAEIRKSAALDPDNADVIFEQGAYALAIGDLAAAERSFRQSAMRDPLHALTFVNLVNVLAASGQLQEAEAAARKNLELDPDPPGGHATLGLILLQTGHPEEALVENAKDTNDESRLGGEAIIYHGMNRNGDGDNALAQLKKRFGADDAYFMAQVHACRGEKDKAFEWLNLAVSKHERPAIYAKADWLLGSLHGDPRLRELRHKMRLPE